MDDPIFIYRNRSDGQFYDVSSRAMRGGPNKVIVYLNGVLCAMDRETKIAIPVSRWKLAAIGFACFLAALKGKGAPLPLELVPLPEEPPSEAASEPLPEGIKSPEAQFERLIQEMRDLAR